MIKKPKILWLTNTHLPDIASEFGLKVNPSSGWLAGAFSKIKENKNIDLTVCFPINEDITYKNIKKNDISFYGFKFAGVYCEDLTNMIEVFKQILDKEKPDIVHIFGTEFPHTLAMVKAFNNPDKTIIGIQGLCSVYTQHYLEGVPIAVINKKSLGERIVKQGLLYEQDVFRLRGTLEIEAIKNANHIMGRTNWDKGCTNFINPNATYHHCNESLREPFYDSKTWSYETIEKYSIFVSQGNYPIKGLHYMLKALKLLKQHKPSVKLYVAGGKHEQPKTFMEKIKQRSYPRYILKLISDYDLSDSVIFTGSLSEQQMHERFLKSHVFVSPSTIENSPNSLGEAMILGVPSVSSDVGGVADLMEHKKEGFVYQSTADYMLAHFVLKLFNDENLCKEFSVTSRKKALITHDKQKNFDDMIKIYDKVLDI